MADITDADRVEFKRRFQHYDGYRSDARQSDLFRVFASGMQWEAARTPPTDRPEVVCICGSTRFRVEMTEANRRLTMGGAIVIAPGAFGHDGDPLTEQDKERLDALHFRKIDMADRVVVVAPGGYIGSSTSREVTYAKEIGKPVEVWDDWPDTPPTDPAPVKGGRVKQIDCMDCGALAVTVAHFDQCKTAPVTVEEVGRAVMAAIYPGLANPTAHLTNGAIRIAQNLIAAGLLRTPVTAEQVAQIADPIWEQLVGVAKSTMRAEVAANVRAARLPVEGSQG